MKQTLLLACCLGSVLSCTSCTTNGDPSTGGLFWSESRAQDRLAERQNKLESIEKQTGAAQRKSAETQRKINALQ
jgi:hypothetical protein